MSKGLAVIFLLVLHPVMCYASESEKNTVNLAISSIDACYHWGGEVGDQSEERNRQINEGVARDCPDARKKALEAYKLYPKNAILAAKLLELIDVDYFPADTSEKNKICQTAFPIFKREYLNTHQQDALFEDECPEHAQVLYGK